MTPRLGAAGLAFAALVFAGLIAAGCSAGEPAPVPNPPPAPAPVSSSPTPSGSATRLPSAEPPAPRQPADTPAPEPTTTNTLPPPPQPTAPAPSTAGGLSARSLPMPEGWRPTAQRGGTEEGYLGNGTWVHARDARYAAQDVLVLGCAPVTRDDYADPTTALEGTLRSRDGEPGIGLVLEFATADAAGAYFDLYRRQVSACTDPQGSVYAEVIDSDAGLIDRRTYPDGEWTEVGRLAGRRITLVILSDPGHQIPVSTAEKLLSRIAATR